MVRPGDLLHGDANGVVSVPGEVVDGVIVCAWATILKEESILNWARSKEFSPYGVLKCLSGQGRFGDDGIP